MSKNKNFSGGLFAARQPTPLTIKETKLSRQIAAYFDHRRIYNDRLNCGKVQTTGGSWLYLCKTGTPDRFAIVCGQIVFVEVKMRDEKPSAEQLKRHDELRQSGAIVIVADEFYRFVAHFEAVCAQIVRAQLREIKLYD
jgi:hypothetical protein